MANKKKNSNAYWAERARLDKIKVIKTGEQGINNLKRILKLNLDDVEKKIKKFYDKYGENPAEKMTHSEFEKYKENLSKKAKKYPNDETLQKIAKQDIPKYKIDRLRALQTDLQIQLTEATAGQEAGIYKTLNDVGKVAQATLAKRFTDSLGLEFNTIASRKMKQLLSSDWSGASWSERLWKDRKDVGEKLTNILEKGIPQGTSLQKMSRELKQVTGQSFNNAFRLIRTETSHIDGQVTLEGYRQAGAELGLEYYEYDAFLDNRTSKICRELDKKRFKVTEAEVGVNYPPMHPNCRSTTQLVLDEDYKPKEGKVVNDTKESREETPEILEKGKQKQGGKIPESFEKAKSIKEAKEYANCFVKNGNSTFDDDITLDNLNAFNNQLEYLINKYNFGKFETIGSFKYTGTEQVLAHSNEKLIEIETKFGAAKIADLTSKFIANKNFRKTAIEQLEILNKEYLNNSTYIQTKVLKVKNELEKRINFSRFLVITSDKNYVRDVVTHEFGHSLMYKAISKDLKAKGFSKNIYNISDSYNKVVTAKKEAEKTGDIYKISYYGSSDAWEFFAESFTIYELGIEKLPKYIHNVIEDIIKNAR